MGPAYFATGNNSTSVRQAVKSHAEICSPPGQHVGPYHPDAWIFRSERHHSFNALRKQAVIGGHQLAIAASRRNEPERPIMALDYIDEFSEITDTNAII